MPELLFGKMDSILKRINTELARYEREHAQSRTSLYRQNSVSVRIRIIDPSFEGLTRAERSKRVWEYLHRLPQDAQSDITVLLLLTPNEVQTSFGNLDFERPVPSAI